MKQYFTSFLSQRRRWWSQVVSATLCFNISAGVK
jgi:hypothetical protein